MSDRIASQAQPDGPVEQVVADAWSDLGRLTTARVGLGRTGVSQPTRAHLAFQLAHAQARDAVNSALDVDGLCAALMERGLPVVVVQSRAHDRATYLQRPDFGRRLDDASRAKLGQYRDAGFDVVLVIADGLSALAVERHVVPLIDAVLPQVRAEHWSIAPVVVVERGRVAISDEIGEDVGARLAVMLIGERPGLSAPDSLGVYLTWNPRVGNTDAGRNCISNIREAGLGYDDAARTLLYLMRESRRRGVSGVSLKDDMEPIHAVDERQHRTGNFLVAGTDE